MLRLFYQRFLSAALLAGLLLSAVGRTPLWPQSSEPSLSSSAGHLTTWEALSNKFTLDLEQHEQTLKELGQKLQTSEASLQRLMPLYELSLQQNESLKTYNGQIAERMQERDQDLALAYKDLDGKDLTIAKKNTLIWKLVAAVIAMGVVITGAAAFAVFKFVVKKKIPVL
jgi:ABC-type maltose transport system permease subunit